MMKRSPLQIAIEFAAFVFGPVVFVACCFAVLVEWDRNSEPEVASYNVYWGRTSRAYGNVLNVSGTRAEITLSNATVFYFAVTAVTDQGFESPFSDEVAWTNFPGAPKILRISRETNAVVLFTADSVAGPWQKVTLPATNLVKFFKQ